MEPHLDVAGPADRVVGRGDSPIAAHRGVLALVSSLGRALLVWVVPVTVIWIPVARVPGVGNVTLGDASLAALWALVGVALVLRGLADLRADTLLVAVLAVALGAFTGIGASLNDGAGAFEFSLVMKRFGLASILPVAAVLFRSRATPGWIRLSTALAVTALAVFTLFPDLQSYLPRPDAWDDLFAAEGRAIGPLTNPNDLAYAAVALAALHAALVPARPRLADRALLVVVLAAAATCAVSSGSRSGFLGLAAGLLFLLSRSQVSLSTRAAVLVAAVAMFVAGMTYSAVFESRLSRAYDQGLHEENVYTRLDAQALAVRTALVYPFGVGYTDFARATARTGDRPFTTADSVYLDTLLGAGFPGLACLLALFVVAWGHIGRAARPASRRSAVLKGGIVAFLFFGTATVVPISVFLSPLFFSLVAGASYFGAEGPP
jgi:O-antigen ligase